MWKRISAGMLAATMVAGLGEAAAAQGLMPSVIGATVANSMNRCRKVTPEIEADYSAKFDALIAGYGAATASGDSAAKRKLFTASDGGEYGADGVVRSGEASSGAKPTGAFKATRTKVVIGGTYDAARGVWKVEPAEGSEAGPPASETFYVADFGRTFWTGGWRIQRIRTFTGGELPKTPDSFCSPSELAPLW